MAKKFLCNERINRKTGETDYYFPLEVENDMIKEYASFHGLEIGWAKLGFRVFEAVFVPCKDTSRDANGNEIFLDTPSEIQRSRYLEYIKDEMRRQDSIKQDGRCNIPDGRGGIKRCPVRVPNPNYIPGGNEKKTVPVLCDGCKYEQYRQAHTVISLSALDYENEEGELVSYEVPSPSYSFEGEKYEDLCDEFLDFISKHNPKLLDFARLLILEYTCSEAARLLNTPISTARGWREKLKRLYEEFRKD